MIKVEVNRGTVNIKEAEGNGRTLMTELCCLVNAVCEAYTDDITDGTAKVVKSEMIKQVANALRFVEENFHDFEDDENADF